MRHRQKVTMTIPYRVRRGLQNFLIAALVLALLATLALGAWMLWLNRYIIYTEDGAKLDFGLSPEISQGAVAQRPSVGETVPISYGNTDELLNGPAGELSNFSGYSVTTEMLTKNLSAVKSALAALPVGSTVLLDVKSVRGEFFYQTALGHTYEKIDIAAFEEILQDLRSKECYVIARIPAFRDFWFFIDDEAGRVRYGLPKKSGSGALWEDRSIPNNLHYWLNPAASGALNYLVQIANELRDMGFDEVVFDQFRYPDTGDIKFPEDTTAALDQAATTLVQACANDSFTVSFSGNISTLPQGRCRLYLEDVAAADIPNLVATLNLENPEAKLVFLTQMLDTRYEVYSVLHPLELTATP